jgi:hypothetical protein
MVHFTESSCTGLRLRSSDEISTNTSDNDTSRSSRIDSLLMTFSGMTLNAVSYWLGPMSRRLSHQRSSVAGELTLIPTLASEAVEWALTPKRMAMCTQFRVYRNNVKVHVSLMHGDQYHPIKIKLAQEIQHRTTRQTTFPATTYSITKVIALAARRTITCCVLCRGWILHLLLHPLT